MWMCSNGSDDSETLNFWITFLRFFEMPLQKKLKKSRCFGFSKNVKNVFSNYGRNS